ncbi:UNVERIFIED_CONTAM: Tau-tubulin kinase 2 [Siphonaria sp. JEL0065]|nr:Tau-tubulin kinase 2 [Siphonaria sp. JEL0065]
MLTARSGSSYPAADQPQLQQQQQQQLQKQQQQIQQNMNSALPLNQGQASQPSSLYNLVIKSRWRLLSTLGKGAFGEVYLANDMLTGEQVAVKIESPACKKQVLKLEISVMRKLQDCPYVAQHIGAGRFTWPYASNINPANSPSITLDMLPPEHPVYSYMVMELLGPNLSELRRKSPSGRFSVATTAILGRQMLRGIQALHEVGILHRDIKPGNFCMSLFDERSLTKQRCYLIDFGLSRRYLGTNGRVREPRSKVGFRGTARYASISAHLGMELSRVDDLWSLFYLLVEFLVGTLPWKGKEKETIGDLKASHTNANLVANLPPCMLCLLDVLNNTHYETIPRYDVIDSCLFALGQTVTSEHVWDENGNGIALYDWEVEGFGDIDVAVMRDNGVKVCRSMDDVDAGRKRVGELLDNQDVFQMSESELAVDGGALKRHHAGDDSAVGQYEGITSLQNGTLADPITTSTAASSSFQNHPIGYPISPHRRFSDQSATSLQGGSNYGSPPINGLPRWERQNSITSIGNGQVLHSSQSVGSLVDQSMNPLLAGRRFSGSVSGLAIGFEKMGAAAAASAAAGGLGGGPSDETLRQIAEDMDGEKLMVPPLPHRTTPDGTSPSPGIPLNLPTPPSQPVPIKKTDVRMRNFKFPSTDSK